ncbi:MAG: electron transfer flavoprotein subunit beta/FixA family protein [Sphaerochaetaceae bacterium]|jgi:electron transfer flavoprotein beta subunit
MEILVLIKQVPLDSNVGADPKTGVIKRENAETKLNPYDLFALETALRLKELAGGIVTVLTMGPPQAEAAIREAFAMGADAGYLLTDRAFAGSDVLATSYALSQAIKAIGAFDLVVCGKQTTDGDTAQVGSECSEFLGVPCLANVQTIEVIDPGAVTLVYDAGNSFIRATVQLPVLISVDKDICQPRLPSWNRMQASKGRVVKKITLDDLADKNRSHYGLDGSPTQVVRIFPPEHETTTELWDDGDLASRLFSFLQEKKFLQELA